LEEKFKQDLSKLASIVSEKYRVIFEKSRVISDPEREEYWSARLEATQSPRVVHYERMAYWSDIARKKEEAESAPLGLEEYS
jgi:hypothetical protein